MALRWVLTDKSNAVRQAEAHYSIEITDHQMVLIDAALTVVTGISGAVFSS